MKAYLLNKNKVFKIIIFILPLFIFIFIFSYLYKLNEIYYGYIGRHIGLMKMDTLRDDKIYKLVEMFVNGILKKDDLNNIFMSPEGKSLKNIYFIEIKNMDNNEYLFIKNKNFCFYSGKKNLYLEIAIDRHNNMKYHKIKAKMFLGIVYSLEEFYDDNP